MKTTTTSKKACNIAGWLFSIASLAFIILAIAALIEHIGILVIISCATSFLMCLFAGTFFQCYADIKRNEVKKLNNFYNKL